MVKKFKCKCKFKCKFLISVELSEGPSDAGVKDDLWPIFCIPV